MMKEKTVKIFRKLSPDYLQELKSGRLLPILEYERKHRKSFMVEIRNNFLDIYFLGHGIEVKHRTGEYFLAASNQFNPKELLPEDMKQFVRPYGSMWKISFNDIGDYETFETIMTAIIMKIVEHKKGNISEGVSEINHFFDNRNASKNGILVIDRQVSYPGISKGRIDLLGLKRLPSGKFTFLVLELKNRNNMDMIDVFSRQVAQYVDIIYNHYEDFRATYKRVIQQKIQLRLLKRLKCEIAPKEEITKKDIEGIVVLDNYNIRSDLKENGLLQRALKDWAGVKEKYSTHLFLKTNILDDTFFMDYNQTTELINNYQQNNREVK